MPLSGGTSGAHDDAMHQGSAKRDIAGGVGGLDASGFLLAKGAGIAFPRTGSDDVHIYERTSGEEAYAFHRVGADDYTFYIKESNVWKRFQTESMKDVVNGIAAISAGGSLLAPGASVVLAKDVTDNINLYERTSMELAQTWKRVGVDDFTSRLVVGGSFVDVQHSGLKDVANGIAGLDAAVKLLWDQMPLPMLTVAQFQANAATGTAANPERINDGSLLGSSTCDIVGEYMQVLFPHPMFISEYRQYGESGTNGDGVWKIQIYHDGAWHDNTTGISTLAADEWSAWVPLTIPVYTQGLRLVATTLDTAFTSNFIQELEIRG